MSRKKKYIKIFGSFTEAFDYRFVTAQSESGIAGTESCKIAIVLRKGNELRTEAFCLSLNV